MSLPSPRRAMSPVFATAVLASALLAPPAASGQPSNRPGDERITATVCANWEYVVTATVAPFVRIALRRESGRDQFLIEAVVNLGAPMVQNDFQSVDDGGRIIGLAVPSANFLTLRQAADVNRKLNLDLTIGRDPGPNATVRQLFLRDTGQTCAAAG